MLKTTNLTELPGCVTKYAIFKALYKTYARPSNDYYARSGDIYEDDDTFLVRHSLPSTIEDTLETFNTMYKTQGDQFCILPVFEYVGSAEPEEPEEPEEQNWP